MPIGSLTGFAVVGDTAIVTGNPKNPYDQYSPPAVAGFDPATGVQRWYRDVEKNDTLTGDKVLFGTDPLVAVPNRTGGATFVEYFSSECTTGICPRSAGARTDETGVAALSARDGSVLWTYAAVPAVKKGTPEADLNVATSMTIVGATDRDLVINISRRGSA